MLIYFVKKSWKRINCFALFIFKNIHLAISIQTVRREPSNIYIKYIEMTLKLIRNYY